MHRSKNKTYFVKTPKWGMCGGTFCPGFVDTHHENCRRNGLLSNESLGTAAADWRVTDFVSMTSSWWSLLLGFDLTGLEFSISISQDQSYQQLFW